MGRVPNGIVLGFVTSLLMWVGLIYAAMALIAALT